MKSLFDNAYEGKRVLVTGHTGFKGSWLVMWLCSLGAKVAGYSAYLPSDPCNFNVCQLDKVVEHNVGDIRDFPVLKKMFCEFEPEVVFHLAAQPIVRRSYDDPKLTFDTNIGGTINILECLRESRSAEAAVIITSDKCYKNVEWLWGYRENDVLGGDDPYSASKAGAEIICHSYICSFFQGDDSARIATGRAGNVVGGGDWANDRIVPDCVKAFSRQEVLTIRNAGATRPWQHVLEPISGYLRLGAALLSGNKAVVGQSFNYGPLHGDDRPVEELVRIIAKYWGCGKWESERSDDSKKECGLLKLNCDKARRILNWQSVLSFEETIRFTAEWYKAFYAANTDMYELSLRQIKEYVESAGKFQLSWIS